MPPSGRRIPLGVNYFTISLSLLDEMGATRVWGTVEAVRVISGQESAAEFPLTVDVNRGGLSLEIDPDLQNPIEIVLSGAVNEVGQGQTMTVTATPAETVDSYQWYLQVGCHREIVALDKRSGLIRYSGRLSAVERNLGRKRSCRVWPGGRRSELGHYAGPRSHVSVTWKQLCGPVGF